MFSISDIAAKARRPHNRLQNDGIGSDSALDRIRRGHRAAEQKNVVAGPSRSEIVAAEVKIEAVVAGAAVQSVVISAGRDRIVPRSGRDVHPFHTDEIESRSGEVGDVAAIARRGIPGGDSARHIRERGE